MLIVTLLAIGLGIWGYHRPAEAVVLYEIYDLPTADVKAIDTTWNLMANSTSCWAVITEQQRASLLNGSSRPLLENEVLVGDWPAVAHASSFIGPELFPSDTSPRYLLDTGQIAGFFGVRKSGGQLQFRMQLNLRHQKDDREAWATEQVSRSDQIEERFLYEGNAPEAYLLVASQFNEKEHHVLIVRVQAVEKFPPFGITQTGNSPALGR
ncbi:hypothetical protein GCM10023155_10290 [Bremerella cremea]